MNWELHLLAGLLIMLWIDDMWMVSIAAVSKELYDWLIVITPDGSILDKLTNSIGDIFFTLLGGLSVILFRKLLKKTKRRTMIRKINRIKMKNQTNKKKMPLFTKKHGIYK